MAVETAVAGVSAGLSALAARDLAKAYGGVRVLDGVSLEIPRGRFVSIMGPSGSGKSTLLHLLGGLDTPTAGEVVFAGRRLSSLPDRERTLLRRRQIGFVFQAFNLVPVLSAAENVALPAVIAGQRPEQYRARVDELLERVGLAPHAAKLPGELSGGQQQRVALARALLPAPEVLLADEPTGNLDSRSGSEVLALLREAQRETGQTVVLVTHDPAAAAVGDEVVLLRDGLIAGQLDLTTPSGKRRRKGGDDRAPAVLGWLQELGA